METYNYTNFSTSSDFAGFRTIAPAGSSAPDFTATMLDTGEQVHLSSLWEEQDLLIEFGSYS